MAGEFLVMAPNGDSIAEVFQQWMPGAAWRQSRADICLIAAAPDLLAALKAILHAEPLTYEGCLEAKLYCSMDELAAARAAIAKAEGES